MKLILFLLFFVNPIIFLPFVKDNFLIKETILQMCMLFYIAMFLNRKLHHFTISEEAHLHKRDRENLLAECKEGAKRHISMLVVLYFASILFSITGAKHPYLVLSSFFMQLSLFSIWILGKNLDAKKIALAKDFILVSSYIVCVYGICQHFGLDFIEWEISWEKRPASTMGNPNFLAGYLVVLIPFAVGVYLSNPKNVLWFTVVLISIFCLFLTKTRGGWITFFVSIFFLIWTIVYRFKRNFFPLFMLLVLALFGIFGYPWLKERFDTKDPSVIERFFKWYTAIEMVKDKPIFGVGAGNLKVNFALYQKRAREKFNIKLKGTSESNVHNEYLQIMSEQGVISFLLFCTIFGVFLLNRYGYILKSKHDGFYEQIGYLSAILAFLVFCLTNFPLRIPPTASICFLSMGLIDKAFIQSTPSLRYSISDSSQPILRSVLIKIKAMLMVISKKMLVVKVVLYLIYAFISIEFILKPLISDIYRRKGDIYAKFGLNMEAIKSYETAIRLNYCRSERTAYDLGELYRKMGMYDNALKAYKIAIDLRNYGEVYNNVANCFWILGDYENALRNWEMALSLGLPNEADERIVERNIAVVRAMLEKTIKK